MQNRHRTALFALRIILFLGCCIMDLACAFDQCVHCKKVIQSKSDGIQCKNCKGTIHVRCEVAHCSALASGQSQLSYDSVGKVVAISAGVSVIILIAHHLLTSTTNSIEGAGNAIGGAIDHTASHLGHNLGDRVSQSIEQAGSEISNSIATTGKNATRAMAFAMALSTILSVLKRIR